MIRVFSFLAVLGLSLIATGVSAADSYKKGDSFVSRAQLQEHGPVRIRINDSVKIRILGVVYQKQPKRNCQLSISGLRKIIATKLAGADGPSLQNGVKVEVHLLPEKSADGELICTNEGEGCVATIEVDI